MGPAHRSRFRSRAAVIVTLAALPILWTPNVVVARKVVGGFRVAISGALLFAGARPPGNQGEHRAAIKNETISCISPGERTARVDRRWRVVMARWPTSSEP
jgi:hypothetical protein